MIVLAVDVGMGTQDILLFDSDQRTENLIKMVLPSQTRIVASRIRKAAASGHNIILSGTTMGGGPVGSAVRQHIQAGFRVFATTKAALTLHDNLKKVRQMGVEIIDEKDAVSVDAEPVMMCDIDTDAIRTALGLFDIQMPMDFAVAVQDHGEAPEMSNRVFRFQHFTQLLEQGGELERFACMNEVPDRLTRMRSVLETLKTEDNNVLLMDTGPAAIYGAVMDQSKDPVVVVNVGNGHTLAAVVSAGRILAIFEHHTRQVDARKMDDFILRLCDGNVSFNEVFDDGGHGCHIQQIVGYQTIQSVIVTGPNRYIMKDSTLDVEFAAPFGDMMLTGCFGLAGMFRIKQA